MEAERCDDEAIERTPMAKEAQEAPPESEEKMPDFRRAEPFGKDEFVKSMGSSDGKDKPEEAKESSPR